MHTAAILVAGGTGSRFGGDLPKQYLPMNGKSVLQATIDKFAAHPRVDDLLVVIAADAELLYQNAVREPRPRFVLGGNSRADSVLAGLRELQKTSPDLVLIHDAARPHISAQQIDAVLDALVNHEGCAPALPIVDAIKKMAPSENKILADADRNDFVRMQTPQGFHFGKLVNANEVATNRQAAHDDISIALMAGMDCITIPGDPANIKITTRDDMSQQTIAISGSGFDVHRICEGKSLFLCGVEIGAGFSLQGHSDADVALHAVTDAILGALAEGDIGDHFPPSDDRWKNTNSRIFLKHAMQLAADKGARMRHVDLTIICERPKVKPYRLAMRECLAEIVDLPLSRVSVKATTTEGLGFTGRGEGIAAQAVVNMELPA